METTAPPKNVAQITVDSIGHMNVLAISGGRVQSFTDGVRLPVRYGYAVVVRLDPNDTYTVQRTFTRSGVESIKAEASNVYCDQVGELAYRAACYKEAMV